MIAIGIRKDLFYPLRLNLILARLKRKDSKLILHSHNYLFSLFSIFRTSLMTVHDPLGYNYRELGKNRLLAYFIEWLTYKRVGTITTISCFSQSKTFLSPKRKSNIIVIPNTTALSSMCRDNLMTHATSLLRRDEKYILSVRSLEKRVGIHNICIAMQLLKRKQPELKLVIAGSGPLHKQLVKQKAEYAWDNILFLGRVSDCQLVKLYQDCIFTVTPSLHSEGFGLPVIESYMFGKQALASNVCALREIIIDSNDLVDNSPVDFANAINSTLCNSNAKHAATYIDYFDNNFSVSTYISRYKKVYSELTL